MTISGPEQGSVDSAKSHLDQLLSQPFGGGQRRDNQQGGYGNRGNDDRNRFGGGGGGGGRDRNASNSNRNDGGGFQPTESMVYTNQINSYPEQKYVPIDWANLDKRSVSSLHFIRVFNRKIILLQLLS